MPAIDTSLLFAEPACAVHSYEPGLRMPRHDHELASFSYVLDGSYTETLPNSRARECAAGMVVFHPSGESHSVAFDCHRVRIFQIRIPAARLAGAPGLARRISGPAEFRGGPAVRLAGELLSEARNPDVRSEMAIEALMLEMLVETARTLAPASGVPAWLETVRGALHDTMTDPLSLDDVARHAGVHPVYLARQFRRHYGISVGEYARRVRLRAACRELTQTSRPILDIALDAGFYDQSHFTNVFRRAIGASPATYRRLYSKDRVQPCQSAPI